MAIKSNMNKSKDLNVFKDQLLAYKTEIDKELAKITGQFLTSTNEQFGDFPVSVTQAFVDLLMRGGKRIRGALAIASYEMFGGKDNKMMVQAAAAIEIFNTCILIADDIQDRSSIRRGGPTAHSRLSQIHTEKHLKGQSEHFGEALAINSLLIAQNFASNIILNLDLDNKTKNHALKNINNCFIVTAHGQTVDIYSEAAEISDLNTVNNILEWKTAYYTFINPLVLGAILAGAPNKDIEQLEKFGLAAGRAFQITDDILGIFGADEETGKSVLDDIKEGKRTILIVKTLQECSKADAYFLQNCLGNHNINIAEFERCKGIINHSGALEYAKSQANKAAKQARAVLDSNEHWPQEGRSFLGGLMEYLLVRKT